jgi:hypothetical protein
LLVVPHAPKDTPDPAERAPALDSFEVATDDVTASDHYSTCSHQISDSDIYVSIRFAFILFLRFLLGFLFLQIMMVSSYVASSVK